MNNKIENIQKVFIVVRKRVRIVKPEKIWLEQENTKCLAVFENRKNATEWISRWMKGEEVYDILERKLS